MDCAVCLQAVLQVIAHKGSGAISALIILRNCSGSFGLMLANSVLRGTQA